ncbi:MAG: amino acid adenylation domain-containing protein [Lachnospiraceae bacterium]|nr:amino acid adenylation domain-containing protein [Lachnospiraceae bacterium]
MLINVLNYLEDTAKRLPDKDAFVDESGAYTYGEMLSIARSIGTKIAEYDFRNLPVIVYLNKDRRVISSFMGILYSGNFYSPIDTTMPLERAKTILGVATPKVVITDEEHREAMESMLKECGLTSTKILIYDEIVSFPEDVEVLNRIRRSAIDMDPAYVLFTSGSTGIPKGVVITHQSIIDYTEWVTETFKITEEDSFGNQAPFYFDNSILDIYTGIKNGATVYIIPKECFSFPAKLIMYLNEHKISTIFFVPSALCNVARMRVLPKAELPYLKKILFCGEVMPNKYLNIWRKYKKDALYANLYGPTEITDVCTAYIVDREFQDDESLPIGKACENTDIVIITDDNRYAERGELGELCVRGRSLALGYYKNPEKSNEVFVQNPVNKDYRDIIYRTGDVVKLNEFDEIIYCGRKDFQIKHMGHRIELGEIETAADALPSIDTCACIYDDEKQKIVFFYKGKVEEEAIRANFEAKVPEYMIPNVMINIKEFPYNANGKIDRKQLKIDYNTNT